MLNKWKERLQRHVPDKVDVVQDVASSLDGEDRIVVSNGRDLAVALRLPNTAVAKPLVIAKVQGAAAVELFLMNAERLYQRVYDHPSLTRVMYDTVPLLQRVTDDVQGEIQRLNHRSV